MPPEEQQAEQSGDRQQEGESRQQAEQSGDRQQEDESSQQEESTSDYMHTLVFWDWKQFGYYRLPTEDGQTTDYLDTLEKWLEATTSYTHQQQNVLEQILFYICSPNYQHYTTAQIKAAITSFGWKQITTYCDEDTSVHSDVEVGEMMTRELEFKWRLWKNNFNGDMDQIRKRTSVVLITDNPYLLKKVSEMEFFHIKRPFLLYTDNKIRDKFAQCNCFSLLDILDPKKTYRMSYNPRTYTHSVPVDISSCESLSVCEKVYRADIMTISPNEDQLTVCIFPEKRVCTIPFDKNSINYMVGQRITVTDTDDLQIIHEPKIGAIYRGKVEKPPLCDRMLVSIVQVLGWRGIVYTMAPFPGFPKGKSPSDYAKDDIVTVKVKKKTEKSFILIIV